MAIMILSSLVHISDPSSIHEVSEAPAFNPSPLDSGVRSRGRGRVGTTPKAYIRTRSTATPGQIAFRFLQRGPNYEILPIRIGAIALHAFYTSISHSAAANLAAD